ncbi:MAG TPA: hypothetical protein DDZ80_29715 [Cyanobacteria bacterium UBA8803]|nr:hypothetical protein [Cyanobacteria bacterium UBA9273]HBL62420.1 hypothetical protein [Cyanobacteria bacterium UBA8803]
MEVIDEYSQKTPTENMCSVIIMPRAAIYLLKIGRGRGAGIFIICFELQMIGGIVLERLWGVDFAEKL